MTTIVDIRHLKVKPSGLQATLWPGCYSLLTSCPSCAVPTRNIWVGHSPPLSCSTWKKRVHRKYLNLKWFHSYSFKRCPYFLTKTFIQIFCLIFLKISGRTAASVALVDELPLIVTLHHWVDGAWRTWCLVFKGLWSMKKSRICYAVETHTVKFWAHSWTTTPPPFSRKKNWGINRDVWLGRGRRGVLVRRFVWLRIGP